MPKLMSVGPTAAAGEAVTDARKARKYIRMGRMVAKTLIVKFHD